jgi:hypothetical protein
MVLRLIALAPAPVITGQHALGTEQLEKCTEIE